MRNANSSWRDGSAVKRLGSQQKNIRDAKANRMDVHSPGPFLVRRVNFRCVWHTRQASEVLVSDSQTGNRKLRKERR